MASEQKKQRDRQKTQTLLDGAIGGWVAAGLRGLTDGITDAGQEYWQQWLQMATALNNLSATNTLLVWAQCPDATRVATDDAWRRAGYQPRDGVKRIMIRCPVTRKAWRDTDLGRDAVRTRQGRGGRTHQVVTVNGQTRPARVHPQTGVVQVTVDGAPAGYRVGRRLDRSQVEPIPGQTPEGLPPRQLRGTHTGDALALLRTVAGDYGWQLSDAVTADLDGRKQGSALLLPDADENQQLRALVRLIVEDRAATTAQTRGQQRVIEDSVAYVTLHALGLDIGAFTFPNVVHWVGDDVTAGTQEEAVDATRQAVLATLGETMRISESLLSDVASRQQQTAAH